MVSEAHNFEQHGIKDVRDLPGGWLVDQWKPFDPLQTKDGGLVVSLYCRAVKILQGDKIECDSFIHPEGFWRDFLALSWTFRTFHTQETIIGEIIPLLHRAVIEDVRPLKEVEFLTLDNGASILRMVVSFPTRHPPARCVAIFKFVRLLDNTFRLFTTTTQLEELEVAPWRRDICNHSLVGSTLPERTDVLVIGGSHAGLSIGAYLSALGIDFTIVDSMAAVGDSWSTRYDSATIHTTKLISVLDSKTYGNILQAVCKEELNLPVYPGVEVSKAEFDVEKKEWSVTTNKTNTTAKHLVFAIGIGGRYPELPDWAKSDVFRGTQMHSSMYKNPLAWKDKKVVVVGTSSTGMDVALDCAKLGIDVVLVQRGATRIYPQGDTEKEIKALWNEDRTVPEADQIALEDAVALQHPLVSLAFKKLSDAHDPAFFEGLEQAGFKGIYEGPIHNQDSVRTGRHYPDVGACAAIINGQIKIKSDSSVERLDATGVKFSDGTHLDADVIVYCTGFRHDLRDGIAFITGEQHKLAPIWGVDREGELRGAYGPSGHDHVWHSGGGFLAIRYMGRFLALQIAAVLHGVRPDPVQRV